MTNHWIPAFAGMTGTYSQSSFPRRRESITITRTYWEVTNSGLLTLRNFKCKSWGLKCQAQTRPGVDIPLMVYDLTQPEQYVLRFYHFQSMNKWIPKRWKKPSDLHPEPTQGSC